MASSNTTQNKVLLTEFFDSDDTTLVAVYRVGYTTGVKYEVSYPTGVSLFDREDQANDFAEDYVYNYSK